MPQSLAKVYIHVVFSTKTADPLSATNGVTRCVAAVREYIRRQPQHHATQTFQDELREWLRRYEIEWDERYLWD